MFPLGNASCCTASPSAPLERKRHSWMGSDRSSAGTGYLQEAMLLDMHTGGFATKPRLLGVLLVASPTNRPPREITARLRLGPSCCAGCGVSGAVPSPSGFHVQHTHPVLPPVPSGFPSGFLRSSGNFCLFQLDTLLFEDLSRKEDVKFHVNKALKSRLRRCRVTTAETPG